MRYSRIIAPIVLITILSGCETRFLRVDHNDPVDTYQICTRLKRQIIFYNNNPNHNFQWRSPGQMASFIQDYQRYNCDAVLAHHGNVTFKDLPLSVPPPATGGKLHHTTLSPPNRHSGNPSRNRAPQRFSPSRSSADVNNVYQKSNDVPDRFR